MTTSVIILIIGIIWIFLWGIRVQNRLVKFDEFCKNSLRQIGVQQVSRYDIIKSVVKLAREYADVEAENLQKVIAARKIDTVNPTSGGINRNEEFINRISGRLIALSERYPMLKANENYRIAMENMKEYEENVRLSRMTYNDCVTKYNNMTRMFPGNLVAGMLGFVQREYLLEDNFRKDFPEI